ncbi:BEN domain-containing protein 5-like [Leptopilina boulardi]|uniref:BEN domain-containing protein 5-like n=1 Tax=Leptopilina boulardi TaxID=63433 RepID=UPI0021F57514|nr:BEN domain-containing protein 5-like [Leptopilina boulardi]
MFAYVKFVDSACESEVKHKNLKIVPVTDIYNFQKYANNKTRVFRVKCGEKWCFATIGLTAPSKEDMEVKLLRGPRAKFPGSALRKENSDLQHQSNDKKQKNSKKKLKRRVSSPEEKEISSKKKIKLEPPTATTLSLSDDETRDINGKEESIYLSIEKENIVVQNLGEVKSKIEVEFQQVQPPTATAFTSTEDKITGNDLKEESIDNLIKNEDIVLQNSGEAESNIQVQIEQVPNQVQEQQRGQEQEQNEKDLIEVPPNEKNKIKINRYSLVNNNQIYLGAGVLVDKDDWATINKRKRKDSLWILSVIDLFYPSGLKDRCIDPKKVRQREDGRVKTPLTPKKIKAMERLYRDRLKKSGINGMRALQEEVKLVRRKITQTINDLNKKSKNPIQQDSDTE